MPPAQPARPRPRSRRALFGAIALLLGGALAVTAAEVGLRVFDPDGRFYLEEHLRYRNEALDYAWSTRPLAEVDLDGTLYRHKPDLDLDLGSFTLRTNALGLRGPAIERQKPPGTFRVLILGDSVAFGWGVDDDVTFVRRFEREVLAKNAPERRCEVVNTGHPMYDTSQELALLRDEGLALQPDAVLLVYVVNDVEPTRDVVEQSLLGRAPDPSEAVAVPGDAWTWLADRCEPLLPALGTFLRLRSDEAERLRRSLPPGATYAPERFGKGPRGWARSRQALVAIRDLCRAAGVPLLVLDHTFPAIGSLPAFCREHGIDCAPFAFTEAELQSGIVNSRLDTHANAKGHELLLHKLVAALRERPQFAPR
jgi:lysophospholipase L1-like esterase